MPTDAEQVIDLIFGRWRSQILAAGTELWIYDHLDIKAPRNAPELAAETGLDAALLYRLLRAQAAIGLLSEDASGGFVLTGMGDLLRTGHSSSLAAMARLEEGPQHYALWKHWRRRYRGSGACDAANRRLQCEPALGTPSPLVRGRLTYKSVRFARYP